MHQYWKGETACFPTKHDGGTEFGDSQMFNTLQVSLLERNVTKTLTEAIFVRETLWMLQGIETTFVYRLVNSFKGVLFFSVIKDELTCFPHSMKMY